MMSSFSNGSLVWVDLGHSYGRWPAEVVDPNDMRKGDSTSNKDVSKSFVPKRDAESRLKENGSEGATPSSSKRPLKDISSNSNANKECETAPRMVSVRFFDDLKGGTILLNSFFRLRIVLSPL